MFRKSWAPIVLSVWTLVSLLLESGLAAYTCPRSCNCVQEAEPEAPATAKLHVRCSGEVVSQVPTFDQRTGPLVESLSFDGVSITTLSSGAFATTPNLKSLSFSGDKLKTIKGSDVFDNLQNLRDVNFGLSVISCPCIRPIVSLHHLSRETGNSVSVRCSLEGQARDLQSLSLEQIGCSALSWRHQPPPTLVNAVANDDITLLCSAHGHPTPMTSWSRDGVVVERNRHLRLTSVQQRDGGVYTCHVTNGVSELEASTTVVVAAESQGTDGEAAADGVLLSAGAAGGDIISVDRIAGGVDALKSQLRAAFDRIVELESQLSSLREDSPSPTPMPSMELSTAQEQRVRELAAATTNRLLEPVSARLDQLSRSNELLRALVMSPANTVTGSMSPAQGNVEANAGQSSNSDVESRLSAVEAEILNLATAGLNSQQNTEVQGKLTSVARQFGGLLSGLSRGLSQLRTDVGVLKSDATEAPSSDALLSRVSALETHKENVSTQLGALIASSSSLTTGQTRGVQRSIATGLQSLTASLTALQRNVDDNNKQNVESFSTSLTEVATLSLEVTDLKSKIASVESSVNLSTQSTGQTGASDVLVEQLRVDVGRLRNDLRQHSMAQMQLNSSIMANYVELKDESSLLQLLISDLNITGLQHTTATWQQELAQQINAALEPLRQQILQISPSQSPDQGLSTLQTQQVNRLVFQRLSLLSVQLNNVITTGTQNSRKITAVTVTTSQLQSDVQSAAAERSALGTSFNSQYGVLRRRVTTLESTNVPAQPQDGDGDAGVGPALNQRLVELQSQVAILGRNVTIALAGTNNKLNMLETRVSTLADEANELSAAEQNNVNDLVRVSTRAMASQISNIRTSVTSVLDKQASFTDSIANIQSQWTADLMSLSTNASAARDSLELRLSLLEAQQAQLASEVDAKFAELRTGLRNVSSQSEQLSTGQTIAVNILIIRRLAGLIGTLNEGKAKTNRLDGQVQSLQSQLAAISGQLTLLLQRPSPTEGSQPVATPQVALDSAALNAIRGQLQSLAERVNSLAGNLESRVDNVQVRLANASVEVQDIAVVVRNLRRQQASDKSELMGLLDAQAERIVKVSVIGSATVDSRLNTLTRETHQIERVNRQLNSDATALKREVTDLSKTLNGVRRSYDRQFRELAGRLSTTESGVRTAIGQYRSVNQQISRQTATDAQLRTQLATLDSKIDDVSSVAAQHNRTEHLTSVDVNSRMLRLILPVSRSLSAATTNVARLTRRVTQAETAANGLSADLGNLQSSVGAQVTVLVQAGIDQATARLQNDSSRRASNVQDELDSMYQTIETNKGNQLTLLRADVDNAKQALRQERLTAIAELATSAAKCNGVAKWDSVSFLELAVTDVGTSAVPVFTHTYAQKGQSTNTTLELELSSLVTVGNNVKLQLLLNGRPCQPSVSGLHTSIRSRRASTILLRGLCATQSPLSGEHRVSLSLEANSNTAPATGSLRETQLTIKELC